MTDAERKKWKWVKPLCLTLGWIQQVIHWIIRIPMLVLWLIFYVPTIILESIGDFLIKWIVNRPFNAIARKLGFFELLNKDRKEQK